jgi:hypothetical protein
MRLDRCRYPARAAAGTAATHPSMKLPIAGPLFAAPPRARSASTSPVSPHTPTSGDSPVCPGRENLLPSFPGPRTSRPGWPPGRRRRLGGLPLRE